MCDLNDFDGGMVFVLGNFWDFHAQQTADKK